MIESSNCSMIFRVFGIVDKSAFTEFSWSLLAVYKLNLIINIWGLKNEHVPINTLLVIITYINFDNCQHSVPVHNIQLKWKRTHRSRWYSSKKPTTLKISLIFLQKFIGCTNIISTYIIDFKCKKGKKMYHRFKQLLISHLLNE